MSDTAFVHRGTVLAFVLLTSRCGACQAQLSILGYCCSRMTLSPSLFKTSISLTSLLVSLHSHEELKISQVQSASTSASQSAFLHIHVLRDKAAPAPSTDVKTLVEERFTFLPEQYWRNENGNTTLSFFFTLYAIIKENSNYERIVKSHLGIKLTMVFSYSQENIQNLKFLFDPFKRNNT